MKLSNIFVFFFLSVINSVGFSQSNVNNPISLTAAIQRGLDGNTEILKQNLELLKTQYGVKEAKSEGLPQLNASAGVYNNLMLSKQLLPGEFFGQPGKQVPVIFGTKYMANGGAVLQQLLYSRQYKVGLEVANKFDDLAKANSAKIRQEVIYEIATVYYQALITNRQKAIIEANLARVDTSIAVALVQYKNDIIRKIDLEQLQVDRVNVLTDLGNANMAFSVQLEQLKILIGHPLNDTLVLSDQSNDSEIDVAINSILDNPALTLLKKQEDLKKLEISNIKAQSSPTITTSAAYGYQSQSQDFKNVYGFPNSVVGLNISIPIFDGYKKQNQIRQREVELQLMKLDQQLTEKQLNVQYKQAISNYFHNQRAVEQQKANLNLAQKVYNVMNNNYKQGISNLTELINIETTLRQAQTRYLTSLLQLNISKLDVLHANGNMEELVKNN